MSSKNPQRIPQKEKQIPSLSSKNSPKIMHYLEEKNYFLVDVSFLFVNLSPCSDSKCRCGVLLFGLKRRRGRLLQLLVAFTHNNV